MTINNTKSFAVTLGAAMLLLATTSQGALAQTATDAFASTQVQAEVVVINARDQDEVFAALQAQGFTVTEVGRTFLGRIRITAESEAGTREVVMHQRTGEILRDVMISGFGKAQADTTVGADAQSSGSSDRSVTSNSTSGGGNVSVSSGGSSTSSGNVTSSGSGSANTSVGAGGSSSTGSDSNVSGSAGGSANTSVSVGGGSVSVDSGGSIGGGISLDN